MPRNSLKEKPDTASQTRERMSVAIAGHVDHGKSTLIGRLLADTGTLPDGKLEQIRQAASRRGMPFEWAFVTDALQAERNQGVTIDVSRAEFKSAKRGYTLIDTPGHKEFLKNMITGAASAEAALLVIDAKEGIKEQSKRHGYLLHLLGVHQIAVLVNKMDAADYGEKTFRAIEKEYRAYLGSIGITPAAFIPVSGREGDNIASHSSHMSWYKGSTLLEALDGFTPAPSLSTLPLRFQVQDIYKSGEKRIIVGRVESGTLKIGDELLFSPTGQRAGINSIEVWGASSPRKTATAGDATGITLTEQVFVERGHLASHVADAPLLTNHFRARLFWLGPEPLVPHKRYAVRFGTAEFSAEVKAIESVIDTDTLAHGQQESVERGQVAEVMLHVRGLAAVDDFKHNPRTGRFVMVEEHAICGGGIIDLTGIHDQRVRTGNVKSKNISALDLRITHEERARMNGHTGGVVWLTGLPSSGKSTLALELQQALFAKGCQVTILDGDNVRRGLNKDLGFSAADRSENIRRIGEVAALFAASGMIVIVSFISPYHEDRLRARAAAPEAFHLVHVLADLATCEKRDVKGLYKKARNKEIKDFTGISAPYELPEDAELTIDTAHLSVRESTMLLMDYVTRQLIEPVKSLKAGH
jgi:bifunctional enzyme CysN/CysC